MGSRPIAEKTVQCGSTLGDPLIRAYMQECLYLQLKWGCGLEGLNIRLLATGETGIQEQPLGRLVD